MKVVKSIKMPNQRSYLSGWAMTVLVAISFFIIMTSRILSSSSISNSSTDINPTTTEKNKLSAWLLELKQGLSGSLLADSKFSSNSSIVINDNSTYNHLNVSTLYLSNITIYEKPFQTINSTFSPSISTTSPPSQNLKSNYYSTSEIYKRSSFPPKNLTHFISPSNGTDITLDPMKIVKMFNQSLNIIPALQLNKDFSVYYCKHLGQGVRFFYLVRDGLLLHPRIHLVHSPDLADVIVYLPVSSVWEKSECNIPKYKNKTLILDEGDSNHLFEPSGHKNDEWLLYFKRSYVKRNNGVFHGYMGYLSNPNILPMTYTIAEAYIKLTYTLLANRDLDIVCSLRGSNHDPVRLRIREWIEQYVKARGIKNAVAGEINSASRTVVSSEYFSYMYRAKIIVTSNPSDWEGDFRLCEAFAGGALIFVDHMYVPRPNPFIHNKHIIYYDNNNKTDIFEKLDYYLKNQKELELIAVQGYLHAMKYHRAANLIDYAFRTIHVKQFGNDSVKLNYKETGYDIRQIALLKQQKHISLKKKHNQL